MGARSFTNALVAGSLQQRSAMRQGDRRAQFARDPLMLVQREGVRRGEVRTWGKRHKEVGCEGCAPPGAPRATAPTESGAGPVLRHRTALSAVPASSELYRPAPTGSVVKPRCRYVTEAALAGRRDAGGAAGGGISMSNVAGRVVYASGVMLELARRFLLYREVGRDALEAPASCFCANALARTAAVAATAAASAAAASLPPMVANPTGW